MLKSKHQNCLKYIDYIPDIIENSDYVGVNPNEKENSSFELIKRYKDNILIIPGLSEPPVRTLRFFRNYPLLLLYPMYLNFASSNCLPHLPYIVRFIIFNLLLVPSTNPLL